MKNKKMARRAGVGHKAHKKAAAAKAIKRAVSRPAKRAAARVVKRAATKSVRHAVARTIKHAAAHERGVPDAKEVKKVEKVGRTKVNVSIPEQADAKKAIDNLLLSGTAVEYLKRNVSKRAVDVINMLAAPETDEALAERLEMKINAIRRILNIMHGYGITNYYVSKNVNGWLSFSWYINANKVPAFLDYIGSMEKEKLTADENCNDFFICGDCYKNDKFIYTFDAAFEAGFKCNCGSDLERVDKPQVESLLGEKNDAAAREREQNSD
jgi:transcription initiation factor TFIIE subunit alpha